MSPRRRAVLSVAAGVLVLAAAGIAGFFRVLATRPVGVPAQTVPASWAEYRTSAGHEQHVGRGSIACTDCHNYEVAGFTNPGASVCGRCHEKEAMHTHAGGEKKTDCLSCHNFAPGAAVRCVDCHREAQGHLAAVSQHLTTECSECHKPHETPALKPEACETCHEERSIQHAAQPGSKNCLDCHSAHAAPHAAAQTCSGCHEKPAGPKPAGHDSCLTCHKPHEFAAAGARVCVGCHGTKPTLVAALVAAHADCTSCHTPHDPSHAENSCRQCHGQVNVTHANLTSVNVTHANPTSVNMSNATLTSANTTHVNATNAGHEPCIGCHVPHSGDTESKAVACTKCHQTIAASDTAAHAGGEACTSCHKPHTFPAAPRGELCATCHAKEVRLATANRGHAECASCHGASAHRPEAAPACTTCHAKEAASAPTGHRKCQACHEPHSGVKTVTAATCTSCHETKTKALHATIQGGCQNCHRAHGPSGVAAPPTCSTCHQRPTLPALHGVAQHQNCATCHTAHAPPRSDRATCTGSCHAKQRDHQASAQVCTGCHVFRR